jgi:hypothetical protein
MRFCGICVEVNRIKNSGEGRNGKLNVNLNLDLNRTGCIKR